jgi:hypothetical protein
MPRLTSVMSQRCVVRYIKLSEFYVFAENFEINFIRIVV